MHGGEYNLHLVANGKVRHLVKCHLVALGCGAAVIGNTHIGDLFPIHKLFHSGAATMLAKVNVMPTVFNLAAADGDELHQRLAPGYTLVYLHCDAV